MSPRQKPSVGDELHRFLSDLDHHNVKRLAERGEAALRLVYSVLNHTIRKEKPKTRSNRRISTVEDLLSRC
jgi:hypothetical protein